MLAELPRNSEGGISVSSLIRRLTNAARSRRRHRRSQINQLETDSATEEYHAVDKIIINAIHPTEAPRSRQEDNSTQLTECEPIPIPVNEESSTHDSTAEEKRDPAEIDRVEIVEIDGPIPQLHHKASTNNLRNAPETSDVHFEPILPNDPSIRSPSSIQRDTIGKYGSDGDSSSGSTSASSVMSSGYIPPPVTGSPGESRMWTTREWLVGPYPCDGDLNQVGAIETRKPGSNVREIDRQNESLIADSKNDTPVKDPSHTVKDANNTTDLQPNPQPKLRAASKANGKEVIDSSRSEVELQHVEPNSSYSVTRRRDHSTSKNYSPLERVRIPNLIGLVSVTSLTVGFTLGLWVRRYS